MLSNTEVDDGAIAHSPVTPQEFARAASASFVGAASSSRHNSSYSVQESNALGLHDAASLPVAGATPGKEQDQLLPVKGPAGALSGLGELPIDPHSANVSTASGSPLAQVGSPRAATGPVSHAPVEMAGGDGQGNAAASALTTLANRLAAVQHWAEDYRRGAATADPPYTSTLGVVNPLSGENAAASLVLRGMRAEFGEQRIVILDRTIFADPAVLRQKMKKHAFRFHDAPAEILAHASARPAAPAASTAASAHPAAANAVVASMAASAGSASRPAGGPSVPPASRIEEASAEEIHVGNLPLRGPQSPLRQVAAAATRRFSAGSAKAEATITSPSASDAGVRPTSTTRAVSGDCHERGTIIVSGGDGTVSFVMDQVHLARCELEEELRRILQPDGKPDLFVAPPQQPIREDDAAGHAPEAAIFSRASPSLSRSGSRERSATPNSSARGSDVDPQAVSLACISHSLEENEKLTETDRRSLVALLSPSHYYTMPAIAPIPMGTGNDYSNCVGFGSGFTRYKGNGTCCCCESDVPSLLEELVTSPSVQLDRWTADFVPLRVAQEHLKPLPNNGQAQETAAQRPLESNIANTVHHVDWEEVRAQAKDECTSLGVTNYLGIGFDGYVTTQFARIRKAHPGLCSSRLQNKAMYGVVGLQGLFRCRPVRKLLPMVCVPNPRANAVPASSSTVVSAGQTDMVALRVPQHCHALVMTNVSRYSSGTKPWKPKERNTYFKPVELTKRGAASGAIVPTTTAASRPPIITPVAINDRKFELMAMGGMFGYVANGLGIRGGTKMAQPGEMFIFVLCTPDDLRYAHAGGPASPYSRENIVPYIARAQSDESIRASLNVQVDGEAIEKVTGPTIVHVYPMSTDRIYVRCRNAEVVRRGSNPDSAAATASS